MLGISSWGEDVTSVKPVGSWNEGDWTAALCLVVLAAFLAVGGLVAVRREPEFAGHPKGLYMLFFAEMWERFSYYGMRALLVFYLTQHWLFSDAKSNLIYGAYTSLVYITPVLGGYLADRYLGQRKAVLFGGILLAFGHCLMAVEGHGGQVDPAIDIFWLALALIIVGSGFLKANISVIVGELYSLTDPRRDGAYTIFYMGINVGAGAGSILVGYLGQTVGWRYGFGLAGIGMVAGLLVFVLGKAALRGRGEAPEGSNLQARIAGISREWFIYGVGVVSVAVIWGLIQYQDVIMWFLILGGIVLLGYVLVAAFQLERAARDRIFAIIFLIALEPLFWALYEQAGGSFNLYTDRFTARGEVPASLFQAVNPIYIMIFAPILAWLWTALGRRGLEPSTPFKFGLGLVQVGISYLVFVWGAEAAGPALTPVIFVFLLYLFQTTGELCLSPVGLSAMTRLAPRHMASLIMGAWFYATAGGEFLAGKIGEATGNGSGGEMTKQGTLAIYDKIGWIAVGVGLVVLVIAPLVKRLMHLDSLREAELAGRDELAEPAAAGMKPKRETAPGSGDAR
jgi:POT family proton-dependent oligopeptide transporter